jgi:hypothetical protein
MNAIELKKYIYENNLYQNILEKCECHGFKPSGNYLRCSLADKNNNAIGLLLNEYLKVKDFSNENLDGDIFSLYSNINNLSFGETIRQIHSFLGLKFAFVKDKKEVDKINPLCKLQSWRKKSACVKFDDLEVHDLDILKEYIPLLYHKWIIEDGIMERTRSLFEIGYSDKYNRVVIPHKLWYSGELVGVIGRTINELYDELDIPKYFPLVKYKKSNNLYGLYENYNEIQKKGYVIVYESEKSVLKRHSRFDGTGVALGSHNLSLQQAKILKGLGVEVIIAFDKDICIDKVFKACNSLFPIPKISFMWDKNGLLNSKDSPADLMNWDFEKMFNERKKYTENMNKLYLEKRR